MTTAARSAPVPSLGPVKMEDRKRSIVADVDESAPPTKRQAVNGVKSHADADMPWKDDLETFQKDAIMRQMKEYKREKETLENRIKTMEERKQYHDDHLRLIDLWFTQLTDELRAICNDMISKQPTDPSATPFPTCLLDEGSEAFQQHLATRTDTIKSTIADIFGKLPAVPPDAAALQARLNQELAAEKEHIRQLHALTAEKDDLSERLENASYRYMLAEKKLDRARSAAVAKLEAQAIQSGAPSGEAAGKVKAEDTAMINGVAEELADRDNLEASRKAALAAAAKREEHVGQLQSENEKLIEQVTALTAKLSTLGDEDYAKSVLYKQFRSQHESVVTKLNETETANAKFREELQKLQAERGSFRVTVDEELRRQVSEAESNLARAEHDAERLRQARDEIQGQLVSEKAAHDEHKQAVLQVRELSAASEERIVSLEAQVENLTARLAQNPGDSGNVEELSSDDLRRKVGALEKEIKMYKVNLPAMEAAWKKAQAVASKKVADLATLEEQVKKANFEKEKTTQKYFSAMKSRDALDAANRTLKSQNLKSSEVISQLKAMVNQLQDYNKTLEHEIAEYRESFNKAKMQMRDLQSSTTQQNFLVTNLNMQIAELTKLSNAKDDKMTSSIKGQRDAETKLEQANVQLEESKKRIDNLKKATMGKTANTDDMLRKILFCHCNERMKNAVLKTCGHAMCRDCAEERIQSRSRQCPRCSKPFGKMDVFDITL